MALACLRLLTFLPEPDFNLPRLYSCISRSTFLPAAGEYLREDFFFEDDFLVDADLRVELDFLLEEDFFFAEDFLREVLIAISFSLWSQMATHFLAVVLKSSTCHLYPHSVYHDWACAARSHFC